MGVVAGMRPVGKEAIAGSQAGRTMKKTIHTSLLLLGVLSLPHRVEAQLPALGGSQTTSPAAKPPAEDPLGRSTPQGAAAGLIRAAEQGNFARAAEYLDSRLALSERR